MTIAEAAKTLEILLVRDADCRCGNLTLELQEVLAIKIAIDVLQQHPDKDVM